MHCEMFPIKKGERTGKERKGNLWHTLHCILLSTSKATGEQEQVDERKESVEKTSHD